MLWCMAGLASIISKYIKNYIKYMLRDKISWEYDAWLSNLAQIYLRHNCKPRVWMYWIYIIPGNITTSSFVTFSDGDWTLMASLKPTLIDVWKKPKNKPLYYLAATSSTSGTATTIIIIRYCNHHNHVKDFKDEQNEKYLSNLQVWRKFLNDKVNCKKKVNELKR